MIRLFLILLGFSLATASTALAQTASDSVTTIPAPDPAPPPASSVPAPASSTVPASTPASAIAASDSTAAVSPSAPDSSETVPPASSTTPVTVFLKDGTERHYVRVERSGSFLIGWRPDGGTDNHRVSKVARVTGDMTAAVMSGEEVGKKKENHKTPGKPFLRGSPLPEQKLFLMVQAGFLVRADAREGNEESTHGWFDVGAMKNVSPKLALGGTIGAANDGNDYKRVVLKPRIRTWLGKGHAIDVAPGVFFPTGDAFTSNTSGNEIKPGSVGFVGELAFVFSDWVQASYMVEVIDTEKKFYSPGLGNPLTTSSETEVFHYFGLKAGGAVGLGLTVLTFAGLFGNSN